MGEGQRGKGVFGRAWGVVNGAGDSSVGVVIGLEGGATGQGSVRERAWGVVTGTGAM